MEKHLRALENRRGETEALIATVKMTIQNMKGQCAMGDKEKFSAFRDKLVRENEEKFGPEARQKYGNGQVDEANRNMMDLTPEQFARWQELDEKIMQRLEQGISDGIRTDSNAAKTDCFAA